jgi:Flp pilus assembly protein TadB
VAVVFCIVFDVLLFKQSPVLSFAIPSALISMQLVYRWSQRRRAARDRHDAIPTWAEETARRLRGGLGMEAALTEGAEAIGPMFYDDFAPFQRSIALGSTPSDALHDWSVRAREPALKTLASLVALGEQNGGVHPRALDGLAGVLRDQEAVMGTAQIHAAQARLSATVLGLAPFFFCGLLVMGDERASHFLLRTPIGLGSAALGVTLDVIGALWIFNVSTRATR